jgi:hypothetical protein
MNQFDELYEGYLNSSANLYRVSYEYGPTAADHEVIPNYFIANNEEDAIEMGKEYLKKTKSPNLRKASQWRAEPAKI